MSYEYVLQMVCTLGLQATYDYLMDEYREYGKIAGMSLESFLSYLRRINQEMN